MRRILYGGDQAETNMTAYERGGAEFINALKQLNMTPRLQCMVSTRDELDRVLGELE